MNVVITMAGLGTRFQKAGFTVPKFMIEVKGKTLFEWSMSSLSDLNKINNVKYIFIVRKETNSKDFIKRTMNKIGINDIDIIEIDYLTDGQATTAYLARQSWKELEEMVIYNIDTYVEPNYIKYSNFTGDGFIPCFNAPGDHWSFVRLDKNGNAIEVKEKERISDNCTIGLYYFKSCKLYEDLYNEYYINDKHLEKNEKYIAPMYNYMIQKGMQVNIDVIPFEKVHVLGTPEELEQFVAERN